MTHFCYKAVRPDGTTVKGLLEADSRQLAVAAMREKGFVPILVEHASRPPDSGSRHFSAARFLAPLRPVPKTAIAAMARQLSTLLQAGLPLDEALAGIQACGDDIPRMRGIVTRLRERIMEGSDLADGLAEFPKIFSSTFVTMVRAGEASGTLEAVMKRLAEHLERQVALGRKIWAALAYPIFMLVVGIGVIIFLLVCVIPGVTRIFADMGRALPLPTQILLGVSHVVRAGWWLVPAIMATVLPPLWHFNRTVRGRKIIHSLWLRLPGIRGIYRPLAAGHMARTLGMLVKNGVSLLKALHIVKSISANVLMAEAIRNMVDGVQAGKDLSVFMDDPLVFPPLMRQMVAAGERSGQTGEMLLWVADDCEKRVAARLQIVTSLMEPVMILLLGGLVGFVVMAIILPIFEMSSLAG